MVKANYYIQATTNKDFEKIGRKVFREHAIITLTFDKYNQFVCNRMFINKVNFEIIKAEDNNISFRELC